MRFLAFLIALPAFAQLFPFPGNPPAAGGASVTVVPNWFSNDGGGSAVTTITSAASGSPTTTGNLLFVFWGAEQGCGSIATSDALGIIHNSASDLVFTPIIPDIGGHMINAVLTSGGSGYGASPTCAVTGGSGGPDTCAVGQTGGVLNSFTFAGGGATYTQASQPVFTFGGGGSGATASATAYGIGNTGSACTAAWYAANITGHTSETITVSVTGTGLAYSGVSVAEVHGANASTPLDGVASAVANAASITATNAFVSSGTADAVVCGSRVEALGQTWTAGTSYSVPANATPPSATVPSTFATIEYQSNFAPNGTKPNIVSSGAADHELICAAFKP